MDGRVMSAPKLDFGRNRQVVVGPDFTRDAMASVINPVSDPYPIRFCIFAVFVIGKIESYLLGGLATILGDLSHP